eukprot:scaffold15248_cov115-Isochrysis_galbana.AAC.2
MLVDYSDSDGEAEAPAPAPPAAAAPARRAAPVKREVSLAALQQTGQLPPGFFETAPAEVEADAGGGEVERPRVPAPKAGSAAPSRGWAGLSAVLPPPSQPSRGQFGSASDVLAAVGRGDRPATRPAALPSAAPTPPAGSFGCGVRVHTDMYAAGSQGGPSSSGTGDTGGGVVAGSEATDVTYSYEAYTAGFGAGDAGRSGSAVGPAPPLMYSAGGGGGRSGGHEVPADYYEAAAQGGGAVVTLSQDQLKRAIGPARPHEVPTPASEVHISASFWNRKTGQIEAGGPKPSKLQKRKHQINTLAAESMQRAHELSAAQASGRQAKQTTAKKYGW